jgi:hypothetical protein
VGLKSFFSRESKDARSIDKWSKKLMSMYQQTAERKRAIESLTRIGSPEAIVALLRRYQYRTESTIVDEEEKEIVFNSCVALGADAIPGLVQYINTETSVYWPFKALRKIVGDKGAGRLLMEAIDGIEDVFGANRTRLEALVENMRELADDDRIHVRLLDLIRHEDEEIVIRAVDALSVRKDDPSVSEAVVPLLLDPEQSNRVRTLIMELMLEQGWNVKRHKKQLVGVIPEIYWIDDTGVVRRK